MLQTPELDKGPKKDYFRTLNVELEMNLTAALYLFDLIRPAMTALEEKFTCYIKI